MIDRTGLTDRFNFVFEFAWDEGQVGIAPHEPAAPVGPLRSSAVFSAIEQQLGLRLEPVRGAREFVVIDGIERPGPNWTSEVRRVLTPSLGQSLYRTRNECHL